MLVALAGSMFSLRNRVRRRETDPLLRWFFWILITLALLSLLRILNYLYGICTDSYRRLVVTLIFENRFAKISVTTSAPTRLFPYKHLYFKPNSIQNNDTVNTDTTGFHSALWIHPECCKIDLFVLESTHFERWMSEWFSLFIISFLQHKFRIVAKLMHFYYSY